MLLFVLGPVLAFRPSPRQRQLERLRRAAVGAGLVVKLCERDADGMQYAEYRLAWRIPDRERVSALRFKWYRDESGIWKSDDLPASLRARRAELASKLAGIHGSCREVRVDSQGVSVQWPERGTQAEVEGIAAALASVIVLLGSAVGT